MSIPNISSTLAAFVQNSADTEAQDWKVLQTDLQKGDLSSALSAFAAMQNDIPNPPQAGKPPSPDILIGEALHALQTALQKIDLSGAQSALVALQSAVKTAYAETDPTTAGAVAASTGAASSQPPREAHSTFSPEPAKAIEHLHLEEWIDLLNASVVGTRIL